MKISIGSIEHLNRIREHCNNQLTQTVLVVTIHCNETLAVNCILVITVEGK